MKKKNAVIILAALLTIAAGLAYLYIEVKPELNLAKPALVLGITTGINQSDGRLIVTNMTFEQTTVPIYYRSADSPVEFPNINVQGRNGTIYSPPVTHWASEKIPVGSEGGKHIMTLTFRESYKPRPQDVLILTIKIAEYGGLEEHRKTAFYEWK